MTLGLSKIAVALFVCGLVPIAGCTRTSDGTIVTPVKPLTVPTINISRLTPRFRRAEPVNLAQFPKPPDEPRASAGQRSRSSRKISVTQTACVEQNKSGERVRVVCK